MILVMGHTSKILILWQWILQLLAADTSTNWVVNSPASSRCCNTGHIFKVRVVSKLLPMSTVNTVVNYGCLVSPLLHLFGIDILALLVWHILSFNKTVYFTVYTFTVFTHSNQ